MPSLLLDIPVSLRGLQQERSDGSDVSVLRQIDLDNQRSLKAIPQDRNSPKRGDMSLQFRPSSANRIRRLFPYLRLLIISLAAATLLGCPLVEEIEELQGKDKKETEDCAPGRPSDIYFSYAINYSQLDGAWVFHNWKGTGPDGGCDIDINVRDGRRADAATVSPAAYRAVISNAVSAWQSVIEGMGITFNVRLNFASMGDAMSTRLPRIECESPATLDGNAVGGRTTLNYSRAGRTFTMATVEIASQYDLDSVMLPMAHADYVRIVTHEFGHVFGILGFNGSTGHSLSPIDVMYASVPCSTVSAGDQATMREIYTREAFYRPAADTIPAGAQKVTADVVCEFRMRR